MSPDMEPLAEDILRAHAADPGGPLFNQLVHDTARAIDRGEVTGMGRPKYENEGMSAVYGGGGTARSNAGVGRKGGGKVLTPKQIRAARKVVAAEKAAAAKEIRAKRAAARKAKRS